MCGRFALHHPMDEVHERFAVQYPLFVLQDRYNIAPTQPIAVVSPERKLGAMRWGLVPRWSKDGRPYINARAETIAEKPAFRANLRSRRVLVPCSGFYEWRAEGKTRLPMMIRLKGGKLFSIAGVWEPGEEQHTVALITVAANELVRSVHDRMPAILRAEEEAVWLDRHEPDPARVLHPYDPDEMELFPVSTRVNGVRDDDAGLIEPVGRTG